MYLLSLKDRRDDGAFAVLNRYGEKVLFMFEEEDDAERYAMMISNDEDADLNVIEIEDALAIRTCKMYNYKYAVITPNDIVVPPPKNDNVSKNYMEELSVNWRPVLRNRFPTKCNEFDSWNKWYREIHSLGCSDFQFIQ